MRYFKAYEQTEKPLIVWSLAASTTQELETLGLDDDPLILAEDDLPEPIFGVCPLKIVAGELVARTIQEMDAFETEYNQETFLLSQSAKLDNINSGIFAYDTEEFPMDERSRIFYEAIAAKTPGGDIKLMTVNGTLYNLLNANIDAFLAAYYSELINLSQPDV